MNQYAAQAYSKAAVHTTVDAASPHQLILMLFDGVLRQVRLAKNHMVKGEIAAKAQCISRAIEIISQGLRGSLNPEAGGEIAANLGALYDYCEQRLMQANARNQVELLDEVVGLIERVRSGWQAIAPQPGHTR